MTRSGSLGSPRCSRGCGCCERAFEPAQLPEAWARPDFKGGSVSHAPAALATLRPCEPLPTGASSRGSRGNRGLGAGN